MDFLPISADDVPNLPLPEEFSWAWCRYARKVGIYSDIHRKVVAEIGPTMYRSYEALTGRHRRVHMRRCFSDLPRAISYLHRWIHARAERIQAELEGREPDPTRALDPNEHNWRYVRETLQAQPALMREQRGRPHCNGTSREARRRW